MLQRRVLHLEVQRAITYTIIGVTALGGIVADALDAPSWVPALALGICLGNVTVAPLIVRARWRRSGQ